jgi:hypothetical protein
VNVKNAMKDVYCQKQTVEEDETRQYGNAGEGLRVRDKRTFLRPMQVWR